MFYFSISTTSCRAQEVDCGEDNHVEVEVDEGDDDDLRAVRNVMA